MNPNNVNVLYPSDTNPLPQTNQLVWWGLVVIEAFLFARLFLKLFGADPANGLVFLVNEVTNFIVYPAAAVLLSNSSGEGLFEWITVVSAIVYFLLAIGVAKVIDVSRSTRSRIEHARTLSRRKYGR